MKRNLIYIICLSVPALFSACTEHTDDNPVVKPSQRGMLSIQARTSNSGEWHSFTDNAEITIYNASHDLDKTTPEMKGIYRYDATNNKWINRPSDTYIGLWSDAIELDRDRGNYYFTATSLNSTAENSSHDNVTDERTIGLDQNKTGYEKYDLLVARSTISEDKVTEEYWEKTGINLHFRHVLSRLKVNVFLPIGKENEGYFEKTIKGVTMALVRPRCKYTVTYDTSLKDSEIARISTNETAETGNLNMYIVEQGKDSKAPGTTLDAKQYSFEAIIPDGQYYPEGQECLNIIVNYNGTNKTFTYIPPGSTIMQFKQEKITVVNLTLLTGKAKDKVILNKVVLQDWVTDKADVDLIPE